jgi:hypothetical protein
VRGSLPVANDGYCFHPARETQISPDAVVKNYA